MWMPCRSIEDGDSEDSNNVEELAGDDLGCGVGMGKILNQELEDLLEGC